MVKIRKRKEGTAGYGKETGRRKEHQVMVKIRKKTEGTAGYEM